MDFPSVEELLQELIVLEALEAAWDDSLSHDPNLRHEEGGWIYIDTQSGEYKVVRAQAGGRAFIELSEPPVFLNSIVIATFHTHPNPSKEGWVTEPSADDESSAWFLGLPCIIRADDGIYTVGPASRQIARQE